jgi:hypothetical protein
MSRIKKALAAAVLAVGMVVATTTPAQALSLTKWSYCPWAHETQVFVNTSNGFKLQVYTPGGAHVLTGWYGRGSVRVNTWREDVRVVLTPNNSSALYQFETRCYYG